MALTRSQAVAVRNEAFVTHYEEVHLQAWRLALYLCGRREDAEDLLSEAVARAIKGFDQLRDKSRFQWWFLRLMRNLHIDHLRARRRQLDVSDYGGESSMWERLGRYPMMQTPQKQLEVREILRALDRLPESLRTPLALSGLEGYSIQEVANIMGIGAGAVKVRIHRARKKLVELLGGEYEVQE